MHRLNVFLVYDKCAPACKKSREKNAGYMATEPWYNQPDNVGKPESAAKSAAGSAMKVAGAAGRGLARGATAMSDFVANNSWSLRLFSFISSIGLFTIAILGLIGILNNSGNTSSASFYLFNSYMIFLALMIFLAECKEEWVLFGRARIWILEQFGFLQTNLGRGAYFVFIGIIWYGAWGWYWGIFGIFVIVVGLLYAAVHWKSAPTDPAAAPQSHAVLDDENDDLP